MHYSEHAPIGNLDAQPRMWISSSLPKLIFNQESNFENKPITREQLLENKWTEITDKTPSDCSFTLILPIHNEESALPSVLEAFRLSILPSRVNAHIILFTNGCSDESYSLAHKWLSKLGPLKTRRTVDYQQEDPGLYPLEYQVKQDNLTVSLLNTKTPGKAHCLNLANQIALNYDHQLTMSVDTNNWLEPDSIAIMYRDAVKYILSGQSLLLSSTAVSQPRQKSILYRPDYVNNNQSNYINGWFISWNSNWLDQVGGFPHTVTEDFGLAVQAENTQYPQPITYTEARIWGYSTLDHREQNEIRRRFALGSLQLLSLFADNPASIEIVKKRSHYAQSFGQRVLHYLRIVMERPYPLSIAKLIYTAYLDERAIRFVYSHLSELLPQTTWQENNSTKARV